VSLTAIFEVEAAPSTFELRIVTTICWKCSCYMVFDKYPLQLW